MMRAATPRERDELAENWKVRTLPGYEPEEQEPRPDREAWNAKVRELAGDED